MPISQEDSRTTSSPSILCIAAEASSCMYAKNFMRQWNSQVPGWNFFGVGDKEMAAMGMSCQGFAEDMAVVGLQEVLAHLPEIKKTGDEIIALAEKNKPQFALLLDYPGFNLRLAKKLKALEIPVVYYISPQLWAWKTGRVKQVRQYVEDMLVVFPFEVDFYKKHDIRAHFVGHPLLEVIAEERSAGASMSGPSGEPILGLMPGSRKSEIKFNLATQLAAAKLTKEKVPGLKVRLLLAPTLDKSHVTQLIPESDRSWIECVQEAPTQMILNCDALLCASGTATLQVALCEKPMVVMYKMNSVTAFFAKLLVRSVSFFCIVNLVAKKEVVPEYFQGKANPQALSENLGKIFLDTTYREQMIQRLQGVAELLGGGKATQNVVAYLKKKFAGGKS